MTETEKMLAGLNYQADNEELLSELYKCREWLHDYNRLRPSAIEELERMLRQRLGKCGSVVKIVQPFYCDYGSHIEVGENFFANYNLTILDEAMVRIGDNCFIGPNVNIYTACHSTTPSERNAMIQWAEAVTIGNNVWIGGNTTILPGVTIGDNVTIGAGSVVTKDIPSSTVAVGNPCKPVKKVEQDSI